MILGAECLKSDVLVVLRAEQRLGDGNRFAEAVGENCDTGESYRVELGEHLRWHVAVENRLLERIVVDEHRCSQRLERCHPNRVEHLGADPSELDLARGDVADDLLLRVGRERSPALGDVDAQSAV